MISLNSFIARLNGTKIEVAGAPLYQCVDLVNEWLKENGLPIIVNRNAIDFVTAPGYKYVANTKTYVPPTGSIAIFALGTFGHVSVVAPGTNVKDLVTFDQNYPIGSACRVVTHRMYAGVKGFLVLETATYTVVKGDNLSKIAAKFKTTYQVLAEMNQISPPYVIYPGQVIKVP